MGSEMCIRDRRSTGQMFFNTLLELATSFPDVTGFTLLTGVFVDDGGYLVLLDFVFILAQELSFIGGFEGGFLKAALTATNLNDLLMLWILFFISACVPLVYGIFQYKI